MSASALAALLVAASPPPISTQRSDGEAVAVSVPASPAPTAINRLAAQLGVSVVVATDLSARRSAGLEGRYTVAEAFERLLQPLGARATPLGRGVYRISSAPPPARPATRPPPWTTEPDPPSELDDVIVTAAVRRGGLDGANGRSALDASALNRVAGAAGSSDAVADFAATVDSTRQGTGRNKLFVRGVADSAFSGPLQATVGQYLGDLRLTYGSPDPDIALVDVRTVEVFEGPQSGRFGAGSVGGVVRITPEPPRLDARDAGVGVSGAQTPGGAPGGDVWAYANQPLGGSGGLRLVAYGRREGGFITNPVRPAVDADGVTAIGARLMARRVGDDWTIDLTGLAQRTEAADAQLVTRPDRLESDRQVAQPYESDLSLAGLSLSRRFSGFRITSANSLSEQVLAERFDASSPTETLVVDRRQRTRALSSETRVETDPTQAWSWNGGLAVAVGETAATRDRHGFDAGPQTLEVDLRRRFAEVAAFGEAVIRPAPDLAFAIGGRVSWVQVRTDLQPFDDQGQRGVEGDGGDRAFSPTLSVVWRHSAAVQVFGRFEQGVRPGGVSENEGVLQRYRPDRVSLTEAGVRAFPEVAPWQFEASAGWIDWRDIQADMVTIGGDLVTGNVGDGVVAFVQARADWRPSSTVGFSGAVFLNRSRLTLEGPGAIGVAGGPIPNVAPVGARLNVDAGPFDLPIGTLGLGLDLRYVGRSRLGLGPGLDAPQGGYLKADLTARLGNGRRAFVLQVSNPFDTRATRYAIGSPYQLFDPQFAPLRPLTVRLSLEQTF